MKPCFHLIHQWKKNANQCSKIKSKPLINISNPYWKVMPSLEKITDGMGPPKWTEWKPTNANIHENINKFGEPRILETQ